MPKNKYGLKFSLMARDDLDQIFSYISGELCAEQAANNLMERIETRIMRLKDYPFSGKK